MISAASSAGEASMNLSGWNSASSASPSRSSRASCGQPADVAGQHAGPLDVVERPVEGLRDGGLDQALAQPDPQLAAEHLDDATWRSAGPSGRGGRAGSPPCAAGPEATSIAANAAATSGSVGLVVGRRRVAGRRSGRPRRRGPGRSAGRRPRPRSPPVDAGDARRPRPRSPTSRCRSRAGPPRRTAGRSGRPRRSAARRASGVAR